MIIHLHRFVWIHLVLMKLFTAVCPFLPNRVNDDFDVEILYYYSTIRITCLYSCVTKINDRAIRYGMLVFYFSYLFMTSLYIAAIVGVHVCKTTMFVEYTMTKIQRIISSCGWLMMISFMKHLMIWYNGPNSFRFLLWQYSILMIVLLCWLLAIRMNFLIQIEINKNNICRFYFSSVISSRP